jgi:hypothetical protein
MVSSMLVRCLRTLPSLLALGLLLGGTPALADDDGDARSGEARVAATCSRGATAQLRLRARDGEIRLEYEVKRRRRGERWRVVLVQERRVVWRAVVRTSKSSGSFRVRRVLDDLDGPDTVTARASGPRGLTCEASATLAG